MTQKIILGAYPTWILPKSLIFSKFKQTKTPMLLEVVSQLSLFFMHYFWLSRCGFSIIIVFHALLLVIKSWFNLSNHNEYLNTWWPSLTVCVFVHGVLTYESLVARNYFICKIWRFKDLIRTILFDNIAFYSFLLDSLKLTYSA